MSLAASSVTSGRHPFFWVSAAATPLCVAIYVSGALALWRYGNFEQSFGWTAAATRDGLVVASVQRGGAADRKLRPGDTIAGVSAGVIPPVGYYRRAAPADRPYTIRIASPQPLTFELTAPVIRSGRLGGSVAVFFTAVAFAAVGLFLGLARPDLPVARLFSLAFVCVGFLQLGASLVASSNLLPRAQQLMFGALGLFPGLSNALLLHAAVRLPGPTAPRLIWPGLAIVLYALGAATLGTFGIPSAILWWTDVDVASEVLFRWPSWFAMGPTLRTSTELLMSVGALVVMGWKLALVRDAEERRRLRWLFAGCIVANIPFTTYMILQATLVSGDPAALRDSSLRMIANGAGVIAPLAVAYAIAKQRIPDITVVVRRGLQYLLARNALTAVLLLPAAGLAYTVIANQNRTIREALFENPTYLALMAAALLALKFRRALRERLDRMFFREAYDRERVLLALVDDMDRFDSIAEVAARISAEIERALHPRHVSVWVREKEKGGLTQAHSSGVSARRGIPPESPMVLGLERSARAVEWAGIRDEYDADRVWLDPLGVELIVPVVASDTRLSGLLMLGARKSEEPYGPDDRELLEAIAKQLAVVTENLRLKERVDEERRIRNQVVERLEGRAINVVKECPRCGLCYDSAVARCASDGQELTISLPVERVVNGQYRLDRLIGRGGMGAVYEAEDLRLQRKVAIKFLIGRAFGEQTAMRRFEREARTCARLSHPNIVTVFDYGTLPAEGAYLVMERLYGATLRDELDGIGWVQPGPAADLFDQILEGIKEAHANGIVHRDLKPENVLIVGPSGGARHVKLLDFGLARLRFGDTAATASVSIAGVIMGTLGYMAPEQFAGATVDERTDIFAFGVMLAEALTGKRPFERPTYAAAMSSMHLEHFHLTGDAATTRTLDGVLQRCLAKDPESRFTTAAELQRELIPLLRACAPNSIVHASV